MSTYANLRPVAPILIGAAVMLSISMGLRQSLGLFMRPAVADLSIAVADFTLAIAIQNLAWGFLQPFSGALAAKYGYRPVMVVGVVLYALGLLVMATATGSIGMMIGAGVLIGTALACCAAALAMAVTAQASPPALRSTVLGLVSGRARSAPCWPHRSARC